MHLIAEIFSRITEQNGWMMAGAGITIVFIGLTSLAAIISQLHKWISIWENRRRHYQNLLRILTLGTRSVRSESAMAPISDIREAARLYHMLTATMGPAAFPLPRLLRLAERRGLARPHATLNELLLAGLIVPDGNGFFYWDEAVRDRILHT